MKKLFSILIFFIININVFSEIEIKVDDVNPAVKQHIILTVEFLDEAKSEYDIEGIDSFKIMSMVSRSNYASVNKKVTYSKSDVYTLCPREEGKTVIIVKSKTGTVSNKIVLNVSKELKENQKEKKFQLETTSYDRDYYFGEKIPFVERVIIKASVDKYSYISTPVFNGFVMKNITPRDSRGFPIPKRLTNENGKEQIELVLLRSILEPVSTGEKIIKSGGIRIIEAQENDTVKDPVYLGFKEININILPLPKENEPKNFSGIVGVLKGNYKWSEKTVEGKQALVLNLKLFGNINLDKLQKITNSYADDFHVTENIIMYDERVLNSVYSSEKIFEIVFIPKKKGEFTPPVIKIPYFDPIQKEYKEFVIDSASMNVHQDEEFYNKGPEKEKEYTLHDTETEISFVIPQKKTEIQEKKTAPDEIKNSLKKPRDIRNYIIFILAFAAAAEALYIVRLRYKLKKRK